jgi:hypothetical protein
VGNAARSKSQKKALIFAITIAALFTFSLLAVLLNRGS